MLALGAYLQSMKKGEASGLCCSPPSQIRSRV